MQFVSVNLDLDDVSIVRQALSLALATCVCASTDAGMRCATCNARAGLIQELERLSKSKNGPRRPRSIPLPASVAFADRREIGFDAAPTLPVCLRLMRGGLADE